MELYQFLNWLINQEDIAQSAVRKSEKEVISILNDRNNEESKIALTYSIYDTERNDKARQYKQDIVITRAFCFVLKLIY